MTTRKQQLEAKLPELCAYLSKPNVFGLYIGGTDHDPEIVLHVEGLLAPLRDAFPSSVTLDLDGKLSPVRIVALPAGKNVVQPAAAVDIGVAVTDAERQRPCPGGFPIEAIGQATLGVNMNWPAADDAFCLLSNNHAISNNERGVTIYQPSSVDKENVIAKTTGFVPIITYPSPDQPSPTLNAQDLAWASISTEMGSPYIQVSSTISVLPNGIREPLEGERVYFVGARSSEQNAAIKSTRYYVKVEWPRPGVGQWAWFEDQILLDKNVTAAGDSGAVYIKDKGAMLVGIHVGANDLGSWGSRLLMPPKPLLH